MGINGSENNISSQKLIETFAIGAHSSIIAAAHTKDTIFAWQKWLVWHIKYIRLTV